MDYRNSATPFGLLGEHLGHSASPEIHAAFGNPDYALFEVAPDAIEDFLNMPYLRGLNVTIPYKQTVMAYCRTFSPLAEAIGSVNTMIREKDGSWTGYNTDAYGLRYMMQRGGLSFTGQDVLVLGNGGVSKTIQAVAKLDGAASVSVASRSGALNYDNLVQSVPDTTLIVNATPVGMYPKSGESLVDLREFPKLSGVAEVIYNPCRTALLQQAQQLGLSYAVGFPMLVAQAKQAEELFFDREISAEKMAEVGARLQRDCENIVLIGMPGSGKTTIGQRLAEMTGRTLMDTDAEIVRTYKMEIPQIFAQHGEAVFREMEHTVLAKAAQTRGIILVTGGGAVTTAANESPLRENGRIYEIARPLGRLARDGRPLSMQNDLSELAARRAPLYEKFRDLKIENTASVDMAAEAVWRDFCAYTRHQWTESEPAGDA